MAVGDERARTERAPRAEELPRMPDRRLTCRLTARTTIRVPIRVPVRMSIRMPMGTMRRTAGRIAIGAGAAGLAVTMTGCSGGSHKGASRGRPSPSTTTIAPISANWPLTCNDPQGDVTVHGSRHAAPGWGDLTSVAWDREPGLVRVAFTTAQAPALSAPGKTIYTTVVRQGTRTARVDAALEAGEWQVTGDGDGDDGEREKLDADVSLSGGTVVVSLPRRLGAGGGTIDMTKKMDVSAAAEVQAFKGEYEDADCNASAPTGSRKRHYITFPVERDSPYPTRTTPRWKTTKKAKRPTSTSEPVDEPTHVRKTSGSGSGSGSGSRPRTPTRPRTHR